jgi:hypothetical protein
MPLVVADSANSSLAPFADSILASDIAVHVHMAGLDPFATASSWTVETVLGGKLLEFLVPHNLELVVKKSVNVAQRDNIVGAAARRHMSRVVDRHGKEALET